MRPHYDCAGVDFRRQLQNGIRRHPFYHTILDRGSPIAKGGPHKRRQRALRFGKGIAELSLEFLNPAYREVGRRFEPDRVGRDDFRVVAGRQQHGLAKRVAREFAKIHRAEDCFETS
jgi:hypothetical protein